MLGSIQGRPCSVLQEGGKDGRTLWGVTVIQNNQPMAQETEPRSSRAHWLLELSGIGAFAVLAALIGYDVYSGAADFGYAWLLPAIAVVAYLAADLASGFVHFLANNFGSEETPVLGPTF